MILIYILELFPGKNNFDLHFGIFPEILKLFTGKKREKFQNVKFFTGKKREKFQNVKLFTGKKREKFQNVKLFTGKSSKM